MLWKLYQQWLLNRHLPARDRVLRASPEWVALVEADQKQHSDDPEILVQWLEQSSRRSALEAELVPDPWVKRAGDQLEGLRMWQAAAAARGRRREDILGVPRRLLGERMWAGGMVESRWVVDDCRVPTVSHQPEVTGLPFTSSAEW